MSYLRPGDACTVMEQLDPLTSLAAIHEARGAHAQAEALYERALAIHEAQGPDRPGVAAVLENLAGVYTALGQYARAGRLHERALRIHEQAFGAEHPAFARSLDHLAMLHRAQGAYSVAVPLCECALRISEDALGPEHPDVAAVLNNLASLHELQGAHALAEPLYERALRIRENALGPEHPDVATSLNNLAGLLRARGAGQRAASLYERALRIADTALGPEHPEVAALLNNLAELFRGQGGHAEATVLCARALAIFEKALGPEHPQVATSLNTLAALHEAQGSHAEAEPLYERALHIRERALGAAHPEVARSLNNLGELHRARGAYARAAPLFERALGILEHALGAEHVDLATLSSNLGALCWIVGDIPGALGHFARAVELGERPVELALARLPEQRRRQLLHAQRQMVDVVASLHAHRAPDSADALALTLTVALRRKGRLVAEVAGEEAALRHHLSPARQIQLDVLQARRAELVARGRAAAEPGHGDALRALAGDVEQLAGELRRTSAAFRAHLQPPTIAAVQAALPGDATLVEFVHYQRFDPTSRGQEWGETRYVAYVLQREGPPRWVALGEAAHIDAAIAATLEALARPGRDARAALRALDELVFAPVRAIAGAADRFLLSPDAALQRVPFAALVDEAGRFLVERARITYVTSGRDLVRAARADAARSRPVVIAAPGAGGEAEALRKHFAAIELHVAPHATKDELLGAHRPMFLHVAAHAFFRSSRGQGARPATRSSRTRRDIAMASLACDPAGLPDLEDALDDAGLLLAGASDAEATVTAREIAGIDLRGTQLVVLSACDAGVGDVAHSKGVYGLRRALAIAGAQAQVVSLWKVDDDATSRLIDRFYGGLRSGRGRSDALRAAQLALLREGPDAHPFYWAAFVPIGDDGPLQLDPRP